MADLDFNSLMSTLKQEIKTGGGSEFDIPSDIKLSQKEMVKGIEITPEPGFTLKTNVSSDNQKVFINICKHDAILEPSKKKKLNDEGEEIEGLNIPMSVGPARVDTDKKGVTCIVHDVIVNPLVIHEAEGDRTGKYRDFVCHLGISCLQQKFGYDLDDKYKLPKTKYKGVVESQRIQDRKNMPQIVELDSKTHIPTKNITSIPKSPIIPIVEVAADVAFYWKQCISASSEYELIEVDSEEITFLAEFIDPILHVNPDRKSLIVLVTLATGTRAYDIDKDINLQVSAYKLKLKAIGFKAIDISFPMSILPTSTTCQVSRLEGKTRSLLLSISMDIDHNALSGYGPDPGSKQWLLAAALHGNDDNMYADASLPVTPPTSSTDIDDGHCFKEDKFHISLPDNVDKYSGVPLDASVQEDSNTSNNDNEELPEDSFHRKDASSSYIIQQRQQGIKDKADKYER
jgi:hypothetical protein